MAKGYKYGGHSVHDIQYHLCWCTKYRYPVLRSEIGQRCWPRPRLSSTSRAAVRGSYRWSTRCSASGTGVSTWASILSPICGTFWTGSARTRMPGSVNLPPAAGKPPWLPPYRVRNRSCSFLPHDSAPMYFGERIRFFVEGGACLRLLGSISQGRYPNGVNSWIAPIRYERLWISMNESGV